MNICCYFICIILVLSSKCETAHFEPSKILTQIGASYVLIFKDDGLLPINCYIDDGEIKYSIDLLQQGVPPKIVQTHSYYLEPKADNKDVITSLGGNLCGFKMDFVSENTPKKWNISIVDQYEKTHFDSTTISIISTNPRHITYFKRVGESFSIYCGENNKDYIRELNYCDLFNPHGELVYSYSRRCYVTIKSSTISDFGVWKCRLGFESHMMETEITYEFIPIKMDLVETWTNETSTQINIGCSVKNSSIFTKYCLMIRPDGTKIALKPGLATERYTALNTNLENSICSLQIVVPLEENEKGLWKCEFHTVQDKLGGFINVSRDSSIFKAEAIIPKKLFVKVNELLSITCKVPFSSPYCYMRGPDGFIYPVEDTHNTTLGECKFSKNFNQSDNGTWFCGFGKQTGEPDEIYKFEVYVLDPFPIKAEVQEVQTKVAGTAKLLCSTKGLGDSGLAYCRFLSPDGKMYHIGDRQMSDRLSYDGRGLEYGDCGIIIQGIEESDHGTWSCITRIAPFNQNKEIYTNIHLVINDDLSLASSLGIFFGVAILIVPTVIFAVIKYRKYKNRIIHRRNSMAETNDSNITLNVINHGDLAVRYSSTDHQNPFQEVHSSYINNRNILHLTNNT